MISENSEMGFLVVLLLLLLVEDNMVTVTESVADSPVESVATIVILCVPIPRSSTE